LKPNPTWDQWAVWLGQEPVPGTIYKDIVDMRSSRRVWEGLQAIVGVAPEKARKYGTYHSWVNGNYIRSQGMAIRRQVDVADDVVSLGRLLDRIAMRLASGCWTTRTSASESPVHRLTLLRRRLELVCTP
jgi:hypothetical protein